jgi:hypothetical protein
MCVLLQVETSCPDASHCLLGKDDSAECRQVTALTIGRLLHTLLQRMGAAAAHSKHGHRGADASTRSSSSSSDGVGSGSEQPSQQPAQQLQQPMVVARRVLHEGAAVAASAADSSVHTDSTSSAGRSTGSGGSGGSIVPSSSSTTTTQQPKLMLYSAHDTTLLPLLAALGQQQDSWPGFTGHLAFELWGHGGQFHVRVLHNGQLLRLPLAAGNATAPAGAGGGAAAGAGGGAAGVAVARAGGGAAAGGVGGCLHAAARRVAVVVDHCWAAAARCVRRAAAGAVGWWGSVGRRNAQPVLQVSSDRQEGVKGPAWGPAFVAGAYVVSLADFQQGVLGDYVMSQKDYARACGAAGGVSRGTDSRQRWLDQFY